MSDRTFLDTNVLVYAFDDSAPSKQATAWQLIEEAVTRGGLVISTQVLQEFYVAVTRKIRNPIPEEDAEQATERLARLPMVQVDPDLVLAAISTCRRYQLSLWDGLIVEAAKAGGCATLQSEDLQDGLRIGKLCVENPFSKAGTGRRQHGKEKRSR